MNRYTTKSRNGAALQTYWRDVFPANDVVRLFSAQFAPESGVLIPTKVPSAFTTRRISFVTDGDNVWITPLSFASAAALVQGLTRPERAVGRIDIGAIYDTGDFKSAAKALEDPAHVPAAVIGAEFKIDVDLDVMGHLRACCGSEKRVCGRCWVFGLTAAQAIAYVLRRIYMFRHVLCVFSGRRGVHVWVFDPVVLAYSQGRRLQIYQTFRAAEACNAVHASTADYLARRAATDAAFIRHEEDVHRMLGPLLRDVLVPALHRIVDSATPLFFVNEANARSPAEALSFSSSGALPDSRRCAAGVWLLVAACVMPETAAGAGTDTLRELEDALIPETVAALGSDRRVLAFVRGVVASRLERSGARRTIDECWALVERRLALVLLPNMDAEISTDAKHNLKLMFVPTSELLSVPFDPFDSACSIVADPYVEVPSLHAVVKTPASLDKYKAYFSRFVAALVADRAALCSNTALARKTENDERFVCIAGSRLDRVCAHETLGAVPKAHQIVKY